MEPTEVLKKQMRMLFSPDDALPSYQQMKTQKQVGGKDCGLFTIANALEVLGGNDVSQVIFDQSKMRKHLISCFENGKISPFPKYKISRSSNSNQETKQPAPDAEWQFPRRSQRIRAKNISSESTDKLNLSNRFEISVTEDKGEKKTKEAETANLKNIQNNPSKSDIIFNLSKEALSLAEQNVLEKGFNFCPTTKFPDKNRVLDDVYSFCRKLMLKEYFHNDTKEDTTSENSNEDNNNDEERCEYSMKAGNPYFVPTREPSSTLANYMSAIKKDISGLMKKPPKHHSNLTQDEREALASLKSRKDIKIQAADKGGKVVVMNKKEYEERCTKDLSNTKFYRSLDEDPTENYIKEIEEQLLVMEENDMISDKDREFLTEHLGNPRLPSFYGLPKIHKAFTSFPPLRPIVSNIQSCTRRISEFVDSFLKYQARMCSSYIKDTKHFLQKLEDLKTSGIPKESILVTMDVASLYTNIDHEEGAEACFQKLENRKNKKVSSRILKSLILLVLKCNAFQFGTTIYEQVMGTCMGTPMAPNYANLFMDRFENDVLHSFREKTGFAPLVWFRYIDDIFFIWTHGEDSLEEFIQHNQNFSSSQKMKSDIRFEVNKSTSQVEFLDVKVILNDGSLKTDLYTKPTDAFLYLNKTSDHPSHVTRNIPKGQFIRIRRICSEKTDFFLNCEKLSSFFVKRGYKQDALQRSIRDVAKLQRATLLEDRHRDKKDAQIIFVCNWHPHLSTVPTILKRHFHLLENDVSTAKIFNTHPMVAFRRPKSIKNHVVKNAPKRDTPPKVTEPCGRNCALCKNIRTSENITNPQNGITIKVNDGGNCKSKQLIYAATCKKCKMVYVGETGCSLAERFGKHRHDMKSRPDNNELASHFYKNHDLNDLEVQILQTGLSKSRAQREQHEDRWICRLQSKSPTGVNEKINHFGKHMYETFKKC